VVRRRGGRKRAIGTRAPMIIPLAPNECWTLDFVGRAAVKLYNVAEFAGEWAAA
jgi:hypothetical protein